MRVVIDTNVVVSARLMGGSTPGHVLELALNRRFEWLMDARIMAEYRDVVNRDMFRFPPGETAHLLGTIEVQAVWIIPDPSWKPLPDESDLLFVEVAVTGHADFLVTGNRKHFPFTPHEFGFEVVTPREFIERLREM